MDSKYMIILDADPGDIRRAVRSLLAVVVTLGLLDRGASIELIFDGPGVQWLDRRRAATDHIVSRMTALIADTQEGGLSWRACTGCAERYGVYEQLTLQGDLLEGGPDSHPSITPLVLAGYQIIEPERWIW